MLSTQASLPGINPDDTIDDHHDRPIVVAQISQRLLCVSSASGGVRSESKSSRVPRAEPCAVQIGWLEDGTGLKRSR